MGLNRILDYIYSQTDRQVDGRTDIQTGSHLLITLEVERQIIVTRNV